MCKRLEKMVASVTGRLSSAPPTPADPKSVQAPCSIDPQIGIEETLAGDDGKPESWGRSAGAANRPLPGLRQECNHVRSSPRAERRRAFLQVPESQCKGICLDLGEFSFAQSLFHLLCSSSHPSCIFFSESTMAICRRMWLLQVAASLRRPPSESTGANPGGPGAGWPRGGRSSSAGAARIARAAERCACGIPVHIVREWDCGIHGHGAPNGRSSGKYGR
ncbi:hypothetical protein ACQJBY_043842 [Aegilops geniculata]